MKATAAAPTPMVKTDHGGIKAKMLAVLAIVLDIQTSYEAYENPSEVNHEILEPLWKQRIEATGATKVIFETTPAGKQSWKYVLVVGFTLEIGEKKYTLQAIGTDAPKGYNSTAEWIRDVKRWPDNEKAMEKKECKGFHFPASNPKPNQATFDALQERCTTNLNETYKHLHECAVDAFKLCKFDGRDVDSISVQHTVGFTLWFNKALEGEQRYLQIQGNFETFEELWLPRFSGKEYEFAVAVYRSHLKRAEWLGRWIDGMTQIMDNRKPSERYAEAIKACEERWEAEKQAELAQPTAVGITATYYKNPKTGLTKSFLVKGDTKPHKDAFKDIGGTWCNGLGGWIFGLGRESQFKAAFPSAQWIASGSVSGKHP